MPEYKVKLIFKYSDIVHVPYADNEKDAVSQALEVCQEEYESFYDVEVEEEE